MKVKKLCYFIEIYFYAFLRFLKYFLEGSQLFSVAFSRKAGKSLKNTNTEDGSFALKKKKKEKKKVISYTAGAFLLDKTLGFLVSAEERDEATLKNYRNKVYFRCRCS